MYMLNTRSSIQNIYNVFTCIKQVHLRIFIQAVQKAEEHLLLVTQERSVYREALEKSRRQAQAHFLLEGQFAPPPPHGMIPPASNNIEWRKYLYDKLREYCEEDVRDIVCPPPDTPTLETLSQQPPDADTEVRPVKR